MELSKEDFERIFEIFKIECDEHIQNLNSGLLSLEKNPDQSGLLIEEIFREAHSLKGAARMLNFTSIEKIAHTMETILGKIKKNEMTLSTEIADLILKGLDTIEMIVNKISQGGAEDEVDSSSILNQLTRVSNENAPVKEPESQSENFETRDISSVKTASVKEEKSRADEADLNLFLQETGEAHRKIVSCLLKIEENPNDEKEIKIAFEQAHALKGSARIIKHAEMGNISFSIERVLQGVLNRQIPVTSLFITMLLEGTDFIKTFINQVEAREEAKIPPDFKKVLSTIDSLVEIHASPEQVEKKSLKTLQSAAPKTISAGDRASGVSAASQPKSTVRVSSEKLDRLIEQTGELLIMKLKARQRLENIQSIIDDSNVAGRTLKKRIRQLGRTKLQKDSFINKDMAVARNSLLSELGEKFSFISNRIEFLHKALYDDYRQLSLIVEKLQDDVKKTRLFPIQTVLDVFPRMVRDLSASMQKKIRLKVHGGDIELDKFILEETKDPLMHIIRNCIDHGIELPEERLKHGKPEEGLIQIDVFHKGNNAVIKVMDDGKGIDVNRIKASAIKKGLYTKKEIEQMKEKQIFDLIFHSGFSTSDIITDISGRGIGMDVVKANIEKLNGFLDIESTKGKGTEFIITIPLTLSTIQALKILVCDEIYFLPVNMVEKIIKVSEKDLPVVEGFPAIQYLDSFIPYLLLSSVLEIPEPESDDNDVERPVVVLCSGKNFAAFSIEKFMGEEEILMKGLGGYMKRVRNVSGITVMLDGNIAPVLNVTDIINAVQLREIALPKRKLKITEAKKELSILVIDDSIMTRTIEKNLLESYGYYVETAVDGQDALLKIHERVFDIIVSDVQMPNMNGLELTEKIKQDERYKKTPVILVTALESAEDKKRGIEVGADADIVKSSFDQSNLLSTIKRLI